MISWLKSASRLNMLKPSIIAIIGATGTGKSKLAVDIALKFHGEIINCDAVQMYNGLPIITNKITIEEQQGVPHHLLGCIGLREPTWTVQKFVPEALRISREIQSRGKLPILVGGTHYYIQSLLVQESLVQEENQEEDTGTVYEESSASSFPILDEPTDVILEELRKVDPVMADRWHPGDRRKIQRSLEIWLKTGKPASEMYEEQSKNEETASLRFNPLVFWLYAQKEILWNRLDARVFSMVDAGLLSEVEQLNILKSQFEADYENAQLYMSRGIWISIGYKEFMHYSESLKNDFISSTDLEKLKREAIQRTQIATRQYVTRQLRWIRNKLLSSLQRAGAFNVYLLDGSDLGTWHSAVSDRAVSITDSFLNKSKLPDPNLFASPYEHELIPKGQNLTLSKSDWQRKLCDHCGVVSVTQFDWDKHIKSNRHRKILASKKRKALITTTCSSLTSSTTR